MKSYTLYMAAIALLFSENSYATNELIPVQSSTCSVESSENSPAWWKEKVVYQVYLKSFKDSNGDGVGDIQGLIGKLDYLKDLGVDVVWINPHYASPNQDNGYDISDYEKIMTDYGTMKDFDRLMSELKKRNMKLMIDVVINHTSDQHKWFVESRKSKDNPYRDYYIWKDGKDGAAPNNYPSYFGGSAWEKDDATGQYYLHYYGKGQPDLNWNNPKVRQEINDMLKFWIAKGVTGLRFDTVSTISKDPTFRDLTSEELADYPSKYSQGPDIHFYIKGIRQDINKDGHITMVGEMSGVDLKRAPQFTDSQRKELDMSILFNVIYLGRDTATRWKQQAPVTLTNLRTEICRANTTVGLHGWNTFFLGNHDNPRAVSQFGNDSPEWRSASAKALATLLLTQRATPFIYQGDEIGMTNYPFKTISDFNDVEVQGFWKDNVETGKVSPEEFMKNLRITARQNSRTPYQWDDSKNAGFTSGTPWLKVNDNYRNINLASQLKDSDSVQAYYKKLIALHHGIPALVYGSYRDLDINNNDVYSYLRELGTEQYLVVINFRSDAIHYALPEGMTLVSTIIENKGQHTINYQSKELLLQPWQSGIYKVSYRH